MQYPCKLSEVGGDAVSQRTECPAWSVPALGLTAAQESVLCNTDPRHVQPLSPWMTYTEPLTGEAGVGSFQLDTCWFGGAAGGIGLPQRAPRHGGRRPAIDQLTSARELDRSRSSSRRSCAKGELTPYWKFLRLTVKVRASDTRHRLQQRDFTDIFGGSRRSHDVHNHQRTQQTCYTTENRLVQGHEATSHHPTVALSLNSLNTALN